MPVHTTSPRGRTPVEPITAPQSQGGWWIPDLAFAVLRIVAALLLAQQGLLTHFGELLGIRGAQPPAIWSEAWVVGWLEIVGAGLLALGLFTRVMAAMLGLLTAFIFFFQQAKLHWPLSNPVQVVILLFVVFIAIAAIGPGLFSIDALIGTRRTRMSPMSVNMSPWIKRQYRRRELTR